MHRMHHTIVLIGLVATSLIGHEAPACASLLHPSAGRAYPDIAADISGGVSYSYDPGTRSGLFHASNTPYLIATGPSSKDEFEISPNASTGVRSQQLSVALDSHGKVLASTQNNYALYGTVKIGDRTYSGTLLQGTPTVFAAQPLAASGRPASSVFDIDLAITGGVLADLFGPTASMRISPELASTFTGAFDGEFSATKARSNTRKASNPAPFPAPEPSTWIVVAMGAGGLAARGRSRRRVAPSRSQKPSVGQQSR